MGPQGVAGKDGAQGPKGDTGGAGPKGEAGSVSLNVDRLTFDLNGTIVEGDRYPQAWISSVSNLQVVGPDSAHVVNTDFNDPNRVDRVAVVLERDIGDCVFPGTGASQATVTGTNVSGNASAQWNFPRPGGTFSGRYPYFLYQDDIGFQTALVAPPIGTKVIYHVATTVLCSP